jgi:hypothetical protein
VILVHRLPARVHSSRDAIRCGVVVCCNTYTRPKARRIRRMRFDGGTKKAEGVGASANRSQTPNGQRCELETFLFLNAEQVQSYQEALVCFNSLRVPNRLSNGNFVEVLSEVYMRPKRTTIRNVSTSRRVMRGEEK